MRRYTISFIGLSVMLFSSAALATDYDDVSADLSGAFGSPTLLTLTAGSNVVTGKSGTTGGLDRDYFRIVVPAGFRLTALNLVSTNTPSATFLGVETGTTFTDPAATAPAQLLGYVHFNTSMDGTDILDNMGVGASAQGFTGPLGPGNYSFWLQENSTPLVNYQLNLVLTQDASPARTPATPWLFAAALALGLAFMGGARRGSAWI